jgi:hypothetical protein
LRGFPGVGIGVHPYPAEVVPKSRLHKGAGRVIERLARRSQRFVDDRRRRNLARIAGLDPLRLQAFVSVSEPVRPAVGARSAAGARALQLRLRNPHHSFGGSVCFLFIFVSGLPDHQFRLERR